MQQFLCVQKWRNKSGDWGWLFLGGPSTHLRTERVPVSEMLCFYFLEYRTMDKIKETIILNIIPLFTLE
jgi:hypothetical protein